MGLLFLFLPQILLMTAAVVLWGRAVTSAFVGVGWIQGCAGHRSVLKLQRANDAAQTLGASCSASQRAYKPCCKLCVALWSRFLLSLTARGAEAQMLNYSLEST